MNSPYFNFGSGGFSTHNIGLTPKRKTCPTNGQTTQTVERKQLQKTDPYLTLHPFAAGDIELDPGSIEQVLFGNTNELFSEPKWNTKFNTWIQML